MVETRSSKRRRLMTISSNVSPQRPDLPATFESLIDDTLTTVLEFVGGRSYRSFGGLNKHCKEIYLNTPGMTKETFLYGYATLSVIINEIERRGRFFNWILHESVGKGVLLYNRRDIFKWALQGRNNYVLRGICSVASKEGKIGVLNKVWHNVNGDGDKKCVFGVVDRYAASGGKLNVLKWLKKKGLYFNKKECAYEAAHHGQLHILEWLREKGLELYGGLYNWAADGDHFNVMKWLREQSCPWTDDIFPYAAKRGNLDILQWLHSEGCPWPNVIDYLVHEDKLKTEVVDWLRVNGYGDRLITE